PATSLHPACTGLPPARTSRRSTGRINGSLAARRVRPSAPNGDTRWVRTSQEANALTRLTANTPITAERATVWISGRTGHARAADLPRREPRPRAPARHGEPRRGHRRAEPVAGEG